LIFPKTNNFDFILEISIRTHVEASRRLCIQFSNITPTLMPLNQKSLKIDSRGITGHASKTKKFRVNNCIEFT
jgi:hypothetical protein